MMVGVRLLVVRLDPDQPAPADLIASLGDDYDEDECDHCGHDAADHDQRLGACDLCACLVFVEPDPDE